MKHHNLKMVLAAPIGLLVEVSPLVSSGVFPLPSYVCLVGGALISCSSHLLSIDSNQADCT